VSFIVIIIFIVVVFIPFSTRRDLKKRRWESNEQGTNDLGVTSQAVMECSSQHLSNFGFNCAASCLITTESI